MSDQPALPEVQTVESSRVPGRLIGTLYAWPNPDATRYAAAVRPNLTGEARAYFDEWVADRIVTAYRLGFESDGWQRSTLDPGAWYLNAAVVDLPDLDHLEED